MKKEKVICLFLFVVLILVFSSCHPRRISDIRPSMTKEEVVSAWGETDLITYKTTDGTTLETWEYHFAGSHSVCQITFNQDRVTDTPQCDRPPVKERYYVQTESHLYPEPYYYPYSYFYYDPYPFYFGGYYPYYRHHYYPGHHHHPSHHPYYRGGSGTRGSQGATRGGGGSQSIGRSRGGSQGGARSGRGFEGDGRGRGR